MTMIGRSRRTSAQRAFAIGGRHRADADREKGSQAGKPFGIRTLKVVREFCKKAE